jgi:hypothetical protein
MTMKGFTEFKGYRTRVEYDADAGTFVSVTEKDWAFGDSAEDTRAAQAGEPLPKPFRKRGRSAGRPGITKHAQSLE